MGKAFVVKGAERAGAEVTYVDLRDYPMPIYNLDEHETKGFDDNALKVQGLLTQQAMSSASLSAVEAAR